MAKATRVHSTPRPFTPKIVGGADLPLGSHEAASSEQRVQIDNGDPVFFEIERHRSAVERHKNAVDAECAAEGKISHHEYERLAEITAKAYRDASFMGLASLSAERRHGAA